MAKKLLNPMEDPPTASSTDEDDDQIHNSPGQELEDEDDEDSSSESKTPIKSAANPDSETDSDSDSDLPRSVKAAAKHQKEAVKSGTKRPNNEATSSKDTKIAKKSKIGDEDLIKTGEESKKPAFQRLWSEQDEITLLQGMIDFKSETGKSPYESTNRFYEIIKESIRFEFSKNQFMDKIRSLKRKYISKEKTGVFSKAHDQKCFELSKIVWGAESANGGASKKSPKANEKKVLVSREEPEDWFENSFIVKSIAGFGVDEDYVKRKWSLVPVEMKKKIEEKLKALQGKEMEFVLEKVELLHKVTSMINGVSKN